MGHTGRDDGDSESIRKPGGSGAGDPRDEGGNQAERPVGMGAGGDVRSGKMDYWRGWRDRGARSSCSILRALARISIAKLFYASLALAFWLLLVPALIPKIVPSWWWFEVRDVRVTSTSLLVSIDRDIHHLRGDPVGFFDKNGRACVNAPEAPPGCREARYWVGDIDVEIRRVLGPEAPSSCRGGRHGLRFVDGAPFPAGGQTLDWFQDSPPNPGCDLPDGGYVADFTWTRDWFGIKLKTKLSSNQFFVGAVPLIPEDPAVPVAPAVPTVSGG